MLSMFTVTGNIDELVCDSMMTNTVCSECLVINTDEYSLNKLVKEVI